VIVVVAYGMVTATLWWAPLYAWFLLVSGWAKRAPFLWAVLPPLGLAVAEKIAMNTTFIGGVIQSRLTGSFGAAFRDQHLPPNTMPKLGIAQIDVAKFVSAPGLWIGLLVAAGLIAATVWMRRRREPI
jgi:ABC-2 type transport system permease protein